MNGFIDIWQYMPHGMCLLWQPWLVFLWSGSDLLIFLSYMAIPVALLRVLAKRKDVPHSGIVVLFASFILLCGVTHLMGIVTLWYPIYPYVGVVKMITGIISMITALALFRLVPALINLPSPGDLQAANDKLHKEVAAHEATLEELRTARDSLEAEVEARTAELKDANTQMAILAQEAVHRSSNLLAVVSSVAKQSAKKTSRTDQFLSTFLGRIHALEGATSAVLGGDDKTSEDLEALVRRQLSPLIETYGDQVKIDGPQLRIGFEAAQQLSLALHELASNVQKFGLITSRHAVIVVRWEVSTDRSGEERFILHWEEEVDNDKAVEFTQEQAGGFGTRLISKIVPQTLKGRVIRRFVDNRYCYSLDVPFASVLADHEKFDAERLAADLVAHRFGTA